MRRPSLRPAGSASPSFVFVPSNRDSLAGGFDTELLGIAEIDADERIVGDGRIRP